MKLSFFAICLFLLVAVFVYIGLASPFSLYDMAILHGMDNSYLKVEKSNQVIRNGEHRKIKDLNGLIITDDNVWKSLHFKSFNIPLPVHHPLFLTIPFIKVKEKDSHIGFKLLDQKEKEMVTLLLGNEFSIKQKFNDKVFNLPFFKNRFQRLDTRKVWLDVFSLNISESKYITNFNISNLLNDPDRIVFKMLYNLYILKLRKKIFKNLKLKKLSFWDEKNVGIVSVQDDESLLGKPQQYDQEVLYILIGDKVFTFYLRSKLDDIAASGYRFKLLNELKYLKSERENAIMLYSEYNTLPYHRKIDQEGMIYLYSAWTHDMDRAAFFAEMINFMERGNSGLVQVNSLYEFALKKFGSNFSSDMKKLKETQYQKLQRKITEEKALELKELQKQKEYIPDSFNSKEHKINFFLDRAKSGGINIDENEKELVGD